MMARGGNHRTTFAAKPFGLLESGVCGVPLRSEATRGFDHLAGDIGPDHRSIFADRISNAKTDQSGATSDVEHAFAGL